MIEARFNILLVVDNKKLEDFARDALVCDETCPKYDVIVVSWEDEALVVVEDGGFDLIFLGVGLPNPERLSPWPSIS